MKKKLKNLLEIDRQMKEHEKFIQNIDDFPYYKVFGDHGKADDLKAAKDELKFLHFQAIKVLLEISEILKSRKV